MTRILLYTGKGGVGKTSIAAATALLCADRGLRTIVLSTDIAHSLADAFDVPLGPEPTLIAPNLDGQEPDVYYNIERYWGTIQSYVSELFAWRGLDEVMAEEMTVLPGMDELGNLLWINDHVESGEYDVIVVDAAPTGETLRLLSLPDASRWWIERIAPIGRRVSRARPADARADARHPDPAGRGLRGRRSAAATGSARCTACSAIPTARRSGSRSRSTSSRSPRRGARSRTSTCSATRAIS